MEDFMLKFKSRIMCLVTLLFSLFVLTPGFAATVQFNSNQQNPTSFEGFGAMVWDGADGDALTTLQNLFQMPGFTTARINHEIRLPTGVTMNPMGSFDYYTNFWNQYGDAALDLLLPNGTFTGPVKHMFLMSIHHDTFVVSDGNGGYQLRPGIDLNSLANYMAAGIAHFNTVYGALHPSNPPKADYVELTNEPDYAKKGLYVSPTQYNILLKNVYDAMLTNGVTGTKITGPGISHVDGTDDYVNALDFEALGKLGAWSVHEYVWIKYTGSYNNKFYVTTPYENIDPTCANGDPSCTILNGFGATSARYFFPKWLTKPKSLVPSLPVVVSEVGTTATGFHGKSYPAGSNTKLCTMPQTGSDCTIVNTTSFGVRIYTYLISLLANGANSALYWEAMDQTGDWDISGLGLYDVNANPKTNYTALSPLFEYIPAGSTVLTSNTSQKVNDIYGAVFLSPRNTDNTVDCITIALANGTGLSSALSRTTEITGLPSNAQIDTKRMKLFTQLGTTVYQGQLKLIDRNATFLLQNGKLTHTTKLSNDQALTTQICLKYS